MTAEDLISRELGDKGWYESAQKEMSALAKEREAMTAEDAISRKLEDNRCDVTAETWETDPDYLYLKGTKAGAADDASHASEEENFASSSSRNSRNSDIDADSVAELYGGA